jgi:hypothetical protein
MSLSCCWISRIEKAPDVPGDVAIVEVGGEKYVTGVAQAGSLRTGNCFVVKKNSVQRTEWPD